MILNFCWPFPYNTLLGNVSVYSEATLNKPVDCVLLGVSGAWWVVAFERIACPSAGIMALVVGEVFDITKG